LLPIHEERAVTGALEADRTMAEQGGRSAHLAGDEDNDDDGVAPRTQFGLKEANAKIALVIVVMRSTLTVRSHVRAGYHAVGQV
jgi:hypothetical protein